MFGIIYDCNKILKKIVVVVQLTYIAKLMPYGFYELVRFAAGAFVFCLTTCSLIYVQPVYYV